MANSTRNSSQGSTLATAIVTNNNDPESLGRVKVQYPWSKESEESDWVRVSTLMAGSEQGFFFMPEVEQEVLVAFVNADVNAPIIIGALWNANSLPPQESDDGNNNIRKIRSRSGHEIVFDDTDEGSAQKLEINSSSGHKIILDDTSGSENITIEDHSGGKIELDASSNKISIISSMDVAIEATNIGIEASGELTLKGALIKIN